MDVISSFKKIADGVYTTGNGVYRIGDENGLLSAYLVETSIGLVQVNTVPELFKTYFPVFKKLPVAIFASEPNTNELGDSYTGFEFELWISRFMDFMNPNRIKFISTEENLKKIYGRLEIPMNGNYVKDEYGTERSKFEPKRWVDDVFEWCPIRDEFSLSTLRFQYRENNQLVIFDKKKLVFDSRQYPFISMNGQAGHYVDTILNQVPHFSLPSDQLTLVVAGTGIGTRPGVTSNFLLGWNNRLAWIDPSAKTFDKARQLGIHLDQVNDFIISHVHEDHIEGFSGILSRKINQGKRMSVLTVPEIYQHLRTIFNPNFGNIDDYIDFTDLNNRKQFSDYHGANIEIRTNYHPIHTLGFKFSFNGKKVGISGDILYKNNILESRLKSGDIDKAGYDLLHPTWFSDCNVVLHDTTVSGDPVHTALADVEELASHLPKTTAIYGYHAGAPIESPVVKQAKFGEHL